MLDDRPMDLEPDDSHNILESPTVKALERKSTRKKESTSDIAFAMYVDVCYYDY